MGRESRSSMRAPAVLALAFLLAMLVPCSLAAAMLFEQTSSPPLAGIHSHGRQLLANSRVAGVGVGIFLILFFMALCLVICLAGSRTKTPWVYYIMSSIVFIIVFAVLAGSPKGDAPNKPDTGYDQTVVPLTIIMIFLCLGIVVSWVGMLAFQGTAQFYAKPLPTHSFTAQ